MSTHKLGVQKSRSPKGRVFAGLDIGSTKVSFVIGQISSDGTNTQLEIAGLGIAPNAGLRQGVVVNIDTTTEAIRKAKEEAELMAGFQCNDVWVGVSGSHIKSFDSKGMVAIKNKEVGKSDIERVIEAAKAVAVPSDRQVIHVLPREFRVDEQDGITDPIGMSGIRLEANVHIVTAAHSALMNIQKCVEKAGCHIQEFVLEPLAAAKAVLSNDEKSLGVCVADFGGGSCHLAYFVNGSVAHTSLIPVGGQHFTHDVAVGLRTPQVSAETLKKKYGCAMSTMVSDTESIEVDGVGGRNSRQIPRKDLADVLEARAEELLQLISHDLKTSGLLPLLGSGIVITGGASLLTGLVEMGEFIFDVPVRRGTPVQLGGLKEIVRSGEFATSVGLLMCGYEKRKEAGMGMMHSQHEIVTDSIDAFAKKIKNLFNDLF
ncbi:MAG: cell division protein FtsA [Bdellovibrionota bacterium]